MFENAFFDEKFWLAVSFLLLVIALFKPVKNAIVKALDAKALQIREELEEAMRLKQEALGLLASFQDKKRDAGDEAAAIITRAEQEVERLKEKAAKDLEDELARREELFKQKLEAQQEALVNDLRTQAVSAAVEAVRSLFASKHLDQKALNNLVDSSVVDIRKKLH